jgi:Ca2+-binding RTX toxin-like protein
MATTPGSRWWRATAIEAAALALLALVPVGAVSAGSDPDPIHGGDVRADVTDDVAPPQPSESDYELSTDCFGEPLARGTALHVPDTSPWTHWFYGTPGDDVIIGTSGPDMIDGGGGDDTICGYQGGEWVIDCEVYMP